MKLCQIFMTTTSVGGHLDDPAVGSVEVRVPPVGHGPVEEPVHGLDVHVDVLGRLHDVVDISAHVTNDKLRHFNKMLKKSNRSKTEWNQQ